MSLKACTELQCLYKFTHFPYITDKVLGVNIVEVMRKVME